MKREDDEHDDNDEDYRALLDEYFDDQEAKELLEYADGACHEWGGMREDIYDLLRVALERGVDALSDEQAYKLYEEFVRPLFKRCATCSLVVQIGVFVGGGDTEYCSYHNWVREKDD
jgi:hypothetical protein